MATTLRHPCGHSRVVLGNLSRAEIAHQTLRPCRACRLAAHAVQEVARIAEREAYLASPDGQAETARVARAERERAEKEIADGAALHALRHSGRWQPGRWATLLMSHLERRLDPKSFGINRYDSASTSSIYIRVRHQTEGAYVIRIADHEAPPGGSYGGWDEVLGDTHHGEADAELTPRTVALCGATWRSVLPETLEWAAEITAREEEGSQ